MLNKIMIIGNVGQAPEQVAGYSKIVNFSVATNEYIKDKCFGYVSEKALKLNKGNKVYIEGRFRSDSYEKDGIKRKSFYILCDKISILDKQSSNNQSAWSNAAKPETPLSDTEKGFIPWE